MLRAFSATIKLVTLPSRVKVPEMVTAQASRTPTSWMGLFTGHVTTSRANGYFSELSTRRRTKGPVSELWKQRVFPGLLCIS